MRLMFPLTQNTCQGYSSIIHPIRGHVNLERPSNRRVPLPTIRRNNLLHQRENLKYSRQ